jgi:hypothetical protein
VVYLHTSPSSNFISFSYPFRCTILEENNLYNPLPEIKTHPFLDMLNYVLKIDLAPGQITSPRITRTLSVPAKTAFLQLHDTIQVAFGWSDSHEYLFSILNTTKLSQNNNCTADCILNLTDWSSTGPPDEESDDPDEASRRKILGLPPKRNVPDLDVNATAPCDVLDRRRYQGKLISYSYDNDWMHFIYVKGCTEPTEDPTCIAGSGHEAIDDIRGTFGFERLKKIYNEKRTAYEKETVWNYENIHFGNVLGLGNGRERVWDKDDINEKLIGLKTLSSRRSSVSGPPSLSSSDMAAITDQMHRNSDESYAAHEKRWAQWEEEERLGI